MTNKKDKSMPKQKDSSMPKQQGENYKKLQQNENNKKKKKQQTNKKDCSMPKRKKTQQNTRFLKCRLDSFLSMQNKSKKKYQFHTRPKKEAPTKTDDEEEKKASVAPNPITVVGRADGTTGEQEKGELDAATVLSSLLVCE